MPIKPSVALLSVNVDEIKRIVLANNGFNPRIFVDFQDSCLNCQILSSVDSGSYSFLAGVFGDQKADRLLAYESLVACSPLNL